MKSIALAFAVGTIVFWGCNSKTYPSHELPEDQIIFGSGGGFTGEVKKYILLKNGQVFQTTSLSNEIRELEDLSKKVAAQFFEQTEHLDTIKLDRPGNRYYFITRKAPGKEHSIVWGSTDYEPPLAVKELYHSLTKQIQSIP